MFFKVDMELISRTINLVAFHEKSHETSMSRFVVKRSVGILFVCLRLVLSIIFLCWIKAMKYWASCNAFWVFGLHYLNAFLACIGKVFCPVIV